VALLVHSRLRWRLRRHCLRRYGRVRAADLLRSCNTKLLVTDNSNPAAKGQSDALLSIRGLTVEFSHTAGGLIAVDALDLDIRPGKTLAVVGESGSGKSVTALTILGLSRFTGARITAGSIRFTPRDGAPIDLATASEERLRQIRGDEIAMIFQEPMTSLNPVFTIGDQITEAIVLHRQESPREARRTAAALLERVRLPDARQMLDRYPHQLSGGMRQRAMIAMALSCRPRLLIADEPTTALDVTVQAKILRLLHDLQQEMHASLLLITHDLGVVASMADEVLVMYAGRIVERADVDSLFHRPRHPYTKALLACMAGIEDDRNRPLAPIEGTAPDLTDPPPGCRFAPRCPAAEERCRREDPRLLAGPDGRAVACLLAQGELGHG
jgi:oligopeptide/dipeptide ABC transporter ATP-binding protein